MLYKFDWLDLFKNYVSYLARSCFDHTLVLVKVTIKLEEFHKYIQFIGTLIDHLYFLEVVMNVWIEECQGDPT